MKTADTKTFRKVVGMKSPRPRLDPDGRHVLTFSFLHNDDKDVRSSWLVKLLDSNEPVTVHANTPLEKWNDLSKRFVEITEDDTKAADQSSS